MDINYTTAITGFLSEQEKGKILRFCWEVYRIEQRKHNTGTAGEWTGEDGMRVCQKMTHHGESASGW